MSSTPATKPPVERTPVRLLNAAVRVVREKGYCAASIDDLCADAGVTKGAFFHHFATKEDLAVAAARYWSETTDSLFADAPYHRLDDPLERVLGYLDFRRTLISGEAQDFTCLVGTMAQETYLTHPAIRQACHESIAGHAARLEDDFAAAMTARGMRPPPTAQSLALHTQAVLQGAFILAKAADDRSPAIESIDHLSRYVRVVFDHPTD
ncbi:MAG: TetR/AcrR family transcriptional regulator [Pseudomonadota bacterium]|nr:TetR/AcrR family transcriptional regulator [Pseudomonadota bacterium]